MIRHGIDEKRCARCGDPIDGLRIYDLCEGCAEYVWLEANWRADEAL